MSKEIEDKTLKKVTGGRESVRQKTNSECPRCGRKTIVVDSSESLVVVRCTSCGYTENN